MFKNNPPVITGISSILFVPSDKYSEKCPVFSNLLPSYELVYKLDGESATHFNSKKLHCAAGTAYLLPKGRNTGYFVERIVPGDCIDIFFHTSSPMPGEAIILSRGRNAVVRNLFLKIQKVWYAKRNGYELECMALFYAILHGLSKAGSNPLPKEKLALIKPAVDYIEAHFCDGQFDYKRLPVLCGISYTHFKNLFRQEFGMPPIRYLADRKIRYACDLLKSHRYGVTEISEMTGFENVYYFSKVFKQTTGLSPSFYRKSEARAVPG